MARTTWRRPASQRLGGERHAVTRVLHELSIVNWVVDRLVLLQAYKIHAGPDFLYSAGAVNEPTSACRANVVHLRTGEQVSRHPGWASEPEHPVRRAATRARIWRIFFVSPGIVATQCMVVALPCGMHGMVRLVLRLVGARVLRAAIGRHDLVPLPSDWAQARPCMAHTAAHACSELFAERAI